MMKTQTRRTNKISLERDDNRIRQEYFIWLCRLACNRKPTGDQRELCWFLHGQRFVGYIPNDKNREIDGEKLRESYADAYLSSDCVCLDGPCSMLEMLIALAQRVDHILYDVPKGDRTSTWFWKMIENLQLEYLDPKDPELQAKVDHNIKIIDQFVLRRYTRTGKGGIFPLRRPYQDQRQVEIWYQMNAWIDENYPGQ